MFKLSAADVLVMMKRTASPVAIRDSVTQMDEVSFVEALQRRLAFCNANKLRKKRRTQRYKNA